MKDFLGQEIKEGDFVVWATMSGRAVSMTYGRFEGLTPKGHARVTPLQGSRWKHGGGEKYIDNRTGKEVFLNSKTHQKEPEYYVRNDGQKFTWEEYHEYVYGPNGYVAYSPETANERDRRREEFDWKNRIPAVMKDYVVKADDPSTVSLQITANIVKVPEHDASADGTESAG